MVEEKYWTVQEVAELLKLRVQTIYGFIRDGRLEAVRPGRSYRIGESALERFLEGRSTRTPDTRQAARLKLEREDESRGR